MQQIVILASSLWKRPSKQGREQLEKHYLKLANYVLSEKIAGREVKAVWFCSSPIISETISEFINDYNITVEFITLDPSDSMLESAQLEQTEIFELTEQETIERELLTLESDFWDDSLPAEIDLYISKNFSIALEIMPPSALSGLPVWFVANIANENPSYLEENGLIEPYIELFPCVFRPKALSLLETCFDDIGDDEPWGLINEYKIQLLCFAKLLHGFVCASDYGFNDFEVVSIVNTLDIDLFYLGALLSRDDFNEISDYSIYDDLWEIAYSSIVNDKINDLISALSNRVGESCLFSTLWWCIWPDLSQSVDNKIDDLFNDIHYGEEESYTRIKAFELIHDGWSDYADND